MTVPQAVEDAVSRWGKPSVYGNIRVDGWRQQLNELVSLDVFEFCYSVRYSAHWNFDSAFWDYDEFRWKRKFLGL